MARLCCFWSDIDRNAYRVELVGNRLEWVTREGNKQVRFDSEPEASLEKRIQVKRLLTRA